MYAKISVQEWHKVVWICVYPIRLVPHCLCFCVSPVFMVQFLSWSLITFRGYLFLTRSFIFDSLKTYNKILSMNRVHRSNLKIKHLVLTHRWISSYQFIQLLSKFEDPFNRIYIHTPYSLAFIATHRLPFGTFASFIRNVNITTTNVKPASFINSEELIQLPNPGFPRNFESKVLEYVLR